MPNLCRRAAAYRDYVVGDPASPNAYLLAELQQLVLGRFMFSGFLP